VLAERDVLEFTRLSELLDGISRKMLRQTLRQMERGRARHADRALGGTTEGGYQLTRLGMSLGAAFCGVWVWAAENLQRVEQARRPSAAGQPRRRSPERRQHDRSEVDH
jgi:DNA-binding HxlR family transcriptional regulator